MFYILKNPMRISLQFFGEGAGGGDGGATGASGVTGATAASQTAGTAQVADGQATVDRDAEFDKLIKGDYKDIYGKKLETAIRERLKGSKAKIDNYANLDPIASYYAEKYGKEKGDYKGIAEAFQNDEDYLAEEALKRDMPLETYMQVRKAEMNQMRAEKELAAIKEAQAKEARDQWYADRVAEAEAVKNIYPSFDLDAELENETFRSLISNNVDMKAAFEVIHKDEMFPAGMQYAAKDAAGRVVNQIIADGLRPNEGGNSRTSTAITSKNIANMTKADREAIVKRVRMGEKITFR